MYSVRAAAAALTGLYWKRAELDRNRDAALRALVKHAYQNVPFYRAALQRSGIHPQDIRGLADLRRIPITTREHIQAQPGDFIAESARSRRLISHRSSGSRGAPVWTKRTLFEERVLAGIRLRVMMKYGLRLSDRRASVSMEESDIPGDDRPIASRFGIFRRTLVNASLPPHQALEALERCAPEVISAYPAALAKLTEFITPEQQLVIHPRLITLGGEMVLSSFRREIKACFQCPTYETYGSTEANLIAWECPATGYLHICEHSVIVEICNQYQPVEVGESGEVIITPLHSYAMPFLRYRLDDLVTRGPAPCTCGYPAATLIAIRGRTNDWFLLPDGRLLHPFVLSEAVMQQVPDVRRLQIIQTSEHELKILIVRGQPLSADGLAEAQSRIAASINHCFQITLQAVKDLDSPPNQKFNPFIPLVGRAADQGPSRDVPVV